MAERPALDACVVLYQPQDPVNIAGTVRAMKNMGVRQLRLVQPASYDASMIERVAHGTRDLVQRIRHFDSLDEAIRDCVSVAGFTARRRSAKREVVTARECAKELVGLAGHGRVALLFGREDRGLPNDALDRAHLVVTIPTTEHASLNLAQAVLLACYELHLQAEVLTRGLLPSRKDAPPASQEQYERLFADAERALTVLDFFRTRYPEHIMRTTRSLTFRASPDAREIELLRAMAIEVQRTIERVRRDRL